MVQDSWAGGYEPELSQLKRRSAPPASSRPASSVSFTYVGPTKHQETSGFFDFFFQLSHPNTDTNKRKEFSETKPLDFLHHFSFIQVILTLRVILLVQIMERLWWQSYLVER